MNQQAASDLLKRDFTQGLIVAFSKGLINFVFNSSTGTYEIKTEITVPVLSRYSDQAGHQFACILDDYIFYTTEQNILRFNSTFEEVITKKLKNIYTEEAMEQALKHLAQREEAGESISEEERQRYLTNAQKDGEGLLSIGAISTNGKNIFVAAEGSLIVFNHSLEELSRVNLDMAYSVKNAHNILVYENIVYLLDNIFHPIYIFKVNISDINNIEITEKHDLGLLFYYRHLSEQWLNPTLNQWLILGNHQGPTGGNEEVVIYSMGQDDNLFSRVQTYDSRNIDYLWSMKQLEQEKEQEEEPVFNFLDEESLLEEYEVCEYGDTEEIKQQKELNKKNQLKDLYKVDEARIEESLSIVEELKLKEGMEDNFIIPENLVLQEGFRILAITNLPPIWAVVIGKEDKFCLAKVESENHEISFSDFLDLEFELSHEEFIIKAHDNYLFIVARSSKILKIIDLKEQAKIVFSQEFSFSESQFGKIIDICPYW